MAENVELIRTFFFFHNMQKKAMDEIKETGKLEPHIFVLTNQTIEDGACVHAAKVNAIMDKNGFEFVLAMSKLAHTIKEFIETINEQSKEGDSVEGVFHYELYDDGKEEKLFTMRGIPPQDPIVRIFKVIRKNAYIGENGELIQPDIEFIEKE